MFGLDYLGGSRYGKVILDNHPEGWAAGFFTEKDLFGDAAPIIRALCRTKRCPAIRVQLMWRDKHDFSEKDFSKIVAEAKRISELARRYRNTTFYFSGACEHNLKRDQAKKLANMVLEVIPKYSFYVNSPSLLYRGEYISGERILNETHGTERKPITGDYFYSWDGTNMVDDDVELRKTTHKSAKIIFGWHPAFNCRLSSNDATPRPERIAYPTPELIDSLEFILKNKRGKTSVPSDWIWKSHADRHNTPPEPRAYKPVLLCNIPLSVKKLELVADNGQVICSSGAGMSSAYPGTSSRWYFPEFGYRISEKAMKVQGHCLLKVRGNGKIYGTVNAAFRDGKFRS